MKAPMEICPNCEGVWSDAAEPGGKPCSRCDGKGQIPESPRCPACAGSLVCAPGHAEPWCYSCGEGIPKDCPDCAAAGEFCDLHAGERPSREYDEDAEVWAKLPEE